MSASPGASPISSALRGQLRRATLWLVASPVLLAAAVLAALLIRGGNARPELAAIVSAVLAGAVVVAAGTWFVGRPLLRTVETLESHASEVEAQRTHAERFAAVGRLAAGLAHEVGNPLCAVTNYAHSLEEKAAPELRGTVQSLQREVGRIERLMEGFIEHTRPREPGLLGADVNDALREALGFLGDQGVLRRVVVETQLDGAALPVRGTSLELEQMFANIFLNAADAMPGGGRLALWTRRMARDALGSISVRRVGDARTDPIPRPRDERLEQWATGRDADEVVKIVVADSGHGVKRGEEEHIFEPFVTTKAAQQGSGLGLAIVRRLVESMHGLVWIQPSREGGAAFHLVLPVHNHANG